MSITVTVTDFLLAASCLDRKGRRLQMNNRKFSGIIITKSGALRLTADGRTVISSPENAIFVPEGSTYLNESLEDAESLLINFSGSTDITEITELSPIPISVAHSHFDILERLSVKATSGTLTDSERFLAISEIYALLSLLFGRTARISESEALFDKAVSLIHKDFCSPSLCCSSLAMSLNVSEVYLRRIFQRYASMPTGRYITTVRMKHARQLILQNLPIKQAAEKVGFADVYSFTRAYTSYFGFSPRKT